MAGDRRAAVPPVAVLGAFIYVLVGWCGLLVPSLIRSIEASHEQTDASIGIYYLLFASAYAAGSLGGGLVTERLGRRPVLVVAAVLLATGLATLGAASAWAVFMLAAIPAGLGLGALDGGANGLYLDLFRSSRARALNLLHLCFSLGALLAPLIIGPLVEARVPWQVFFFGTGIVALLTGVPLLVLAMPDGRHATSAAVGTDRSDDSGSAFSRIPTPLMLMCVAIGCYVASEVGVTDWLVRFLASAPLSLATAALFLYWAGLAVGRVASARIADRFDHVVYATVAAIVMSLALLGAILAPSVQASIVLFGVAGLAAGPIAPMIVVVGGDRYPDRSAAVGGYLTTAAVVGSIGLPTLMGLLSVTVGLSVAMLGTVAFGLASVAALLVVGRNRDAVALTS